MYEEIMTNDDNLESNLLTSSLLKNVWSTCWYKLNCVVYCSVAGDELRNCVQATCHFKLIMQRED